MTNLIYFSLYTYVYKRENKIADFNLLGDFQKYVAGVLYFASRKSTEKKLSCPPFYMSYFVILLKFASDLLVR